MNQRNLLNELTLCFPNKRDNYKTWVLNEIEKRKQALKDYADTYGIKQFVLGISGGLDSFVCGSIAAATGIDCFFIMLPCGEQADLQDAKDSIQKIVDNNPNTLITYTEENIGKVVYELEKTINPLVSDPYLKGNIAARIRMIAQYGTGEGEKKPFLVLGTDHATENVIGYYTKYGDGGSDYNPLDGLLKTDIYSFAEMFKAPEFIMVKPPAAGLGISNSDEEELGLSYFTDIIPFLEGHIIDKTKSEDIISRYEKTRHKRQMPISILNPINKPVHRTHIIIDCVYDFINGSLACIHAEKAVQNIIDFINSHPNDKVIFIAESHPGKHCSFKEQGGIWPAHAVRGTIGGELHADFYTKIEKCINRPIEHFNIFRKGMDANQEEYSAFNAQNIEYGSLVNILDLDEEIVVSGIATEYCVAATVNDLVNAGFKINVLKDGLGYVNYSYHQRTLEDFSLKTNLI